MNNVNKNQVRRLFIFAGYDPAGIVDDAELMYVRALAAQGDVIYVMDSDADAAQIARVQKIPNVIHATGVRHGEYDFGSYKRGYQYARDKNILGNYDVVYMVNNSVYGPLGDMSQTLARMEAKNTDAFGPTVHPNSGGTYIESWFLGMRPSVFATPWFDKFISGVKPQPHKGHVIFLYERGFTNNVVAHGLGFSGLFSCRGRGIYNRVKSLYKRGLPFIKRNAFVRHGGALGRQISYVLRHTDPQSRAAILDNARRVYGEKYISGMLTRNPIKIAYRNIAYMIAKLTKVKK